MSEKDKYGIPAESLKWLVKTIRKCGKVRDIILFGSRAKGCWRPFSDIDISITGNELDYQDLLSISEGVDDLLLPYEIDLLVFNDIKNPALIREIRDYGVVL